MQVYKFGGASVKNADAVRNILPILKQTTENTVVVISAMGKTTNALERLTDRYVRGDAEAVEAVFDQVKNYHLEIVRALFNDPGHPVFGEVDELFEHLAERLQEEPSLNYDYDYDQVIGYGEMLSTQIIARYLEEAGLPNRWLDIRRSLKTDHTFREGKVDWELSSELIKKHFVFGEEKVLITQGFLGSNRNNQTVSLGREGSDYTAAILAYILDAGQVTIWKDVPGVLNADPKYFDDTILLKQLSYLDAIELAYYGASVIHPKTIKPLQNRNISLFVRSFRDSGAPGTVIGNLVYDTLEPSFIFKMDQVLLRISPHDFSFITEDNLERIFGILHANGMKINLMQNSAVSFLVAVNHHKEKLRSVVDALETSFRVSYETGLELITIRYFDEQTIRRVMINKTLILEQRGTQNIQLLVRDDGMG